ncbi:UDP-N-acetylmuramoyl-tripeptide--D-alanyl-D-alanine ligase [Convivina intestini]|uniref:UDP-N-acetylmuramoyl-tripeptide--D-alanyl-D-alanine ligase n=1 Tax=Convivina intestini TaxID=1505726 RepID=A0A2U1DBR1_9LACO|nr:UDP-N-acetylmuramoyl-tripeptide--D-alanyl-D-alanine ligase [Convivina intestini]PVY85086.1 UDP-N-acetylmuramoyl-tripeptide--D-alanyl-D-alanine ligase [Convivina intestini]CAH1853665.1 UDP-N-acetylmuramoyl-tripeptide--D-alanyl-D-alanine ligase [Convivina intestini]SDB88748.1 UDP-N-acetylmuramoyl-tripeptide--D-alanyl-D-alanine ligase [Leuconostocaceae bacterium R-53105]
MKLTLSEITNLVGGYRQGADLIVTGVTFDSRQVKPGDLFVALVAENDGHRYIDQALAAGAVAVLADQQHPLAEQIPAVIVADTLAGLQQLGRGWLQHVQSKVVAITGSNGKTTTKDMTAAILASQYKTFKTPENFNNEIGVPMTLLAMPVDTEVLVVELGMDRPGQLTQLSDLVRPDIAVITMIGEAHIEFFKTRDKIAQAKLEIIHGLKPKGPLLIPDDEPLLTKANLSVPVLTFGSGVSNIVSQQQTTDFVYQGESFAIPLLGLYNVVNALAAIKIGQLFQISITKIKNALANLQVTSNRLEYLTSPTGVTVLSDVYNANPTATKLALEALGNLPAHHHYAVLGDMLELGEQAGDFHAQLAPAILAADLTDIYLVGDLMTKYLAPVLVQQLGAKRVHCYLTANIEPLLVDLQQQLGTQDAVLLKGSHGIHLERVVAALMNASS